MKEKADAPEKKERHQDGVIRASRAMNQRNYIASMQGCVPWFYNFWTLLTAKLSFWTYDDAKSPQTYAFGVVESSIKTGVYGQILPPAAGKLWEKSHVASSLVEPLGWYFCWHGITSAYGTRYFSVRKTLTVLPHSTVENSAISPTPLTTPIDPAYPSFQGLCMLFISSGEDRMAFHVFVFLLVSFFMLSLAWLCRLSLLHRGLAPCRAGAVHPVVRRLLKPRTPLDCPACCLSSPVSAGAVTSPLPVRPWSEVKSRRGAPKRIEVLPLEVVDNSISHL